MSFSATVKDELCRLELGKNCCMLSELAALYRTSGSLPFPGGGRVQVPVSYTHLRAPKTPEHLE